MNRSCFVAASQALLVVAALAPVSGCIFLVDDASSGGGGAGAGGAGATVVSSSGTSSGGAGGAGGGGPGGAGGEGGSAACPINLYTLEVPNPSGGATVELTDLAANADRIAIVYQSVGPAKVYAGLLPATLQQSDVGWVEASLTENADGSARIAFDVGAGVTQRLYVVTSTEVFRSDDPTNQPFARSAPYPVRQPAPAPLRVISLAEGLLAVAYQAGGLDTMGVIGVMSTPPTLAVVPVQHSEVPYSDLARLDVDSTQFIAAPTGSALIARCNPSNGCLGTSNLSTPAVSLQVRPRANAVEGAKRLVAYVSGEQLIVASCGTALGPLQCPPQSVGLRSDAKVRSVGLAQSALLAAAYSESQHTLYACCAVTADDVSSCNELGGSDVPAAPLVQIVPIGEREFVARDADQKLHRIRVGD